MLNAFSSIFDFWILGEGNGTVFFAGEHTCAAFQGYVHGGILSGRRAAAEVLLANGGNDIDGGKVYDWSCELLKVNHTTDV